MSNYNDDRGRVLNTMMNDLHAHGLFRIRIDSNVSEEVKNIVCESCGNVYHYVDVETLPSICTVCGHTYGEPKQIQTISPEDTKPNTHNQIRITCRNCNNNAIVWLPKGTHKVACPKVSCPNCGSTDSNVKFSKIKPEGECRSEDVWEPVAHNEKLPTKPKRKVVPCSECGCPVFYLVRPPIKCNKCGENIKYDSSANNTTT